MSRCAAIDENEQAQRPIADHAGVHAPALYLLRGFCSMPRGCLLRGSLPLGLPSLQELVPGCSPDDLLYLRGRL